MIAEALLGPYTHPNGSADSVLEQSIMSLLIQRMRTLGAHEVGHTLGGCVRDCIMGVRIDWEDGDRSRSEKLKQDESN